MNILQLIKQADSLSPEIQNLLKKKKLLDGGSNDSKKFPSCEALKSRLSDIEFRVTQNKDTEKPYTGKYLNEDSNGIYKCLICGTEIFDSDSKYFPNCGWPSFKKPIEDQSLLAAVDVSSGKIRVEISCKKCKSHLGHVFDDGPKPTGLRYCINSCALSFQSDIKSSKSSNHN